MKDKKSFILYADIIYTVRKMTKQKAGELFLTILSYVNDENPVVTDKMVDLVFEPIKLQLKRDLIRWKEFKEKQSLNGKLGGRPKTQNKPKNPSLFLKSQKSLNVNATVNVKREEEEKKIPLADLSESNLFRKPDIPTKTEVLEAFVSSGGTKEMAKKFYETYEATGWYLKNSPIKNFKTLVYSFVENWKKNLKKDFTESSAPPLKYAGHVN